VIDGLLAATAMRHDLTLVTRNTKDIAPTGVAVLNPWTSETHSAEPMPELLGAFFPYGRDFSMETGVTHNSSSH